MFSFRHRFEAISLFPAFYQQAGTGPSRRHIQGSKIAKGLPSVNLQKNSKNQKMDPVARWGPLARAPGALKGGHFRNCQHFCRS